MKTLSIDCVILSMTATILLSFFTWLLFAIAFDLNGVLLGMFPAMGNFLCAFFHVILAFDQTITVCIDFLVIIIVTAMLTRMLRKDVADGNAEDDGGTWLFPRRVTQRRMGWGVGILCIRI